jgi:hypothetical protein
VEVTETSVTLSFQIEPTPSVAKRAAIAAAFS